MHRLRLGPPVPLYSLLAVALVAAIVPFARVLSGIYNVWNLKPEYSHGIIIPVLSALLIWRQREDLRRLPFTGSWLGLPLIAAGLALRSIGELTTLETVEHYAFLLVIYGLVLALTGRVIFRRLWMPLLILVFAIPLPSIFNNALSLQLQLWSSELGVWVIRAAGTSVFLEGNVIDLGTYQLEVAEACSGLRYLLPLMTLAFLIAYVFRAPMWKRITIFLSSVPITVLMNSLRIGFIGVTVEHWGAGMAEGALHDAEGWVVFMFSTGALVLTAFGLTRLGRSRTRWSEAFDFRLAPVRREDASKEFVSTGAQTVPRSFLAAAALVLVGAAAGVAMPAPHATSPSRVAFDEFPVTIGEWVGQREKLQSVYLDALMLDDYMLADYREPSGQAVNVYIAYYQTQDADRHVHSPRDCIPGGGWEIRKFEQRPFPSARGGEMFPANRAIIQMGSDQAIVYYWFQVRGRRFTNQYVMKWYLLWDAMTRHRTDGALVRFVAPVSRGTREAVVDSRIMKLGALVDAQLTRFVPD
jgi:exosortase D (VPLPA-CTERM-specific)